MAGGACAPQAARRPARVAAACRHGAESAPPSAAFGSGGDRRVRSGKGHPVPSRRVQIAVNSPRSLVTGRDDPLWGPRLGGGVSGVHREAHPPYPIGALVSQSPAKGARRCRVPPPQSAWAARGRHTTWRVAHGRAPTGGHTLAPISRNSGEDGPFGPGDDRPPLNHAGCAQLPCFGGRWRHVGVPKRPRMRRPPGARASAPTMGERFSRSA